MRGDTTIHHVIDRFEGPAAVVEGLGAIPRALLPPGAAEGDVLVVEVSDHEVRLRLDPQARAEAEAETRRLQEGLIPLDLSGDGPLEL